MQMTAQRGTIRLKRFMGVILSPELCTGVDSVGWLASGIQTEARAARSMMPSLRRRWVFFLGVERRAYLVLTGAGPDVLVSRSCLRIQYVGWTQAHRKQFLQLRGQRLRARVKRVWSGEVVESERDASQIAHSHLVSGDVALSGGGASHAETNAKLAMTVAAVAHANCALILL